MEIYNELRKRIINLIREGKDPFPEIIGQEEAKKQLISSLIAGRHVIIVGPPGIGKTTLAKSVAKLLPPIKFPIGIPRWAFPEFPFTTEEHRKKWKTGPFIEISGYERFVRIQGSPDLTVEDLIGDLDPMMAFRYGPLSPKAFTPGKIFRAHRGVLFFDELNRAPPKVQNALLQVLEEKRVTIGPYELEIPVDFIFIATMNPEDFAGTERLSDVLLDRFDIVYMGYPETDETEIKIVREKGKRFLEFPNELLKLVINFIRKLREDERLEKKPSVRASIGIYEKAQTLALIKGKEKVDIGDVKEALISVLSHRIRLKPSYRYEVDIKEFIKKEFEKFLQTNFFKFREESLESRYLNFNSSSEGKQASSLGKGSGLPGSVEDYDKSVSKFLEDAVNRGIFRFHPDEFFNECIKNFEEAKRFYGKNIIEFLFDEDIYKVEKNISIPEFRRRLKENLSKKLRFLKINKILSRDYRISEEILNYYLLKIVESEILKLEAYIRGGLKELKDFGLDSKSDEIIKSSGRYYDIDVKKSLREIIKRRRIYYDTFLKRREVSSGTYEFVIALDISGSMKGEKIKYAKKACLALAYYSILNDVPTGLILFNSTTNLIREPTFDFDSLAKEILPVVPLGSTNIAQAIADSLKIFKGPGHLTIITDAAPNVGEDPVRDTIRNVEKLRNNGITTSIVGIELDDDCLEIAKKIANAGGGKLYLVKDYEKLGLVMLIDYLCFLKKH